MSVAKKNNWFIAGISSIFLGIISSAVYDFIKSKPVLSTLIYIFKYIWDNILYILTADLEVWWIVTLIVVYKIFRYILKEYINEKEPGRPDYTNYKSDVFRNWIWKWVWVWAKNNKQWQISNLRPYCPTCDIELLNRSSLLSQLAVCPKCQKQYRDSETEDTEGVMKIIDDNIRKRRY